MEIPIVETDFFQSVEEKIFALDLSMIRLKLMDKKEGLGWNYEQCEKAEYEYKRFLILVHKYPEKSIVPTVTMDVIWHYHILDTRKYAEDSKSIFGYFLHHFPYFGLRGEEDQKNLVKAFEVTKKLYKENFGEEVESEYSHCEGSGGNCYSNCTTINN